MVKQKQSKDIAGIYISERLQEGLRHISHHTLTTVVAPMGYGKTTAVSWYLNGRQKTEPCVVVRISVYSDNLAILWKSVQSAFSYAGLPFLDGYERPVDAAGEGLLCDEICHRLAGAVPYYIFIDDFHLLTEARESMFLVLLAMRLPDNVHLIVASRDLFLPGGEILRLGNRLWHIGVDLLRLNHTELSVYAGRCGVPLSDAEIESLLYSTEGWFAAVYLQLTGAAHTGHAMDDGMDIYGMFSAAMLDPLPEDRRCFLAVMGLADEFGADMAEYITGAPDTAKQLAILTAQNAFVTWSRTPDGIVYRFHHMMKECARRLFAAYPTETKMRYSARYGAWYENHGQYLHALAAYRTGERYADMLRVIRFDAGILLAALKPSEVLDFLEQCPREILLSDPASLLVLMRRLFTWRQIPKMLRLRDLLLEAAADPSMEAEEAGNLRGECDLIMSFLAYNDISAMSRLHRSASAQMNRPAVSIRNEGSWTFGSPSVLLMFHRTPGMLDTELAEMCECMPHYYRITSGHGYGAEMVMAAEAAYLRGDLADAAIALTGAKNAIDRAGQENMRLCCDFLARRLSLFTDAVAVPDTAAKRAVYHSGRDGMWLHIFDADCAYTCAVAEDPEHIPALFREHRLDTVHFLAPCRPMMEMIENQVYLAAEEPVAVIGRSAELLARCADMHYAAVALHIRLQTAAAYEMLGKRSEARTLVEEAIRDALPDGLVMPFCENYRYIAAILDGERSRCAADTKAFLDKARAIHDHRRQEPMIKEALPDAFAVLTNREREIVRMIGARLSNREIAEQLYLTEGTVKQYGNAIYTKLGLTGNTKRRTLIAMLGEAKNGK